MGKKEKLVLAGTALATAVTSIFGGGSERANATEHINPPRPPADHQLNNFENPDPHLRSNFQLLRQKIHKHKLLQVCRVLNKNSKLKLST